VKDWRDNPIFGAFTLLWAAFMVLVTVVSILLAAPFLGPRRAFFTLGPMFYRAVFAVCGIRYTIEGWENLPEPIRSGAQPAIFMCNHESQLDPPFLVGVVPSHFFIPRHYSGVEYKGGGPVYATQAWGSTTRSYEALAGDARGSETGQAFLFRPDWGRVDWVEVLLAYLNAFEAGEPVGLILLPSTEDQGGLPLAQAESRVLDVIARFGRDVVPEIILLEPGEDVLPFLRRFGKVSWVPEGRGNTRGLQGSFGARLAASRRALARNAGMAAP